MTNTKLFFLVNIIYIKYESTMAISPRQSASYSDVYIDLDLQRHQPLIEDLLSLENTTINNTNMTYPKNATNNDTDTCCICLTDSPFSTINETEFKHKFKFYCSHASINVCRLCWMNMLIKGDPIQLRCPLCRAKANKTVKKVMQNNRRSTQSQHINIQRNSARYRQQLR
eukprot:275447_1